MIEVQKHTSGIAKSLKICPFMRGAPCAGARCMAWVWVTEGICKTIRAKDPKALIEPVGEHRPFGVLPTWEWAPADDGGPAGWIEPIEEANQRRLGRCGAVQIDYTSELALISHKIHSAFPGPR